MSKWKLMHSTAVIRDTCFIGNYHITLRAHNCLTRKHSNMSKLALMTETISKLALMTETNTVLSDYHIADVMSKHIVL